MAASVDGGEAESVGEASTSAVENVGEASARSTAAAVALPRMKLYRFEHATYGELVLMVVPEDNGVEAPKAQWFFLHEWAMRDDGPAFFAHAIKHGRLSVLDLIALRRAVDGLTEANFRTLPSAGSKLYEKHHGRQCAECTPGPPLPLPGGSPDVGGGGPPPGPRRPPPPDQTGGLHKGPGFNNDPHPYRGAGSPPPPPLSPQQQATAEAGRNRGFIGSIRASVARATVRLLSTKLDCIEACGSFPALVIMAKMVCADPGLRAIPQSAVGCAYVTAAEGPVSLGALGCGIWCDYAFDEAAKANAERAH
jgi:hypothetical protein